MSFRVAISDSVTTEPINPAHGDSYILPSVHTGKFWSGFSENDLVVYSANIKAWRRVDPDNSVIVVFVLDKEAMLYFSGQSWRSILPRH
ncbi:MAG: DUF2793 domain-containing protein [Chloroflexi bacterium]|nr:DUF2793 domain-containing protein [Chloroflexota bacterium]